MNVSTKCPKCGGWKKPEFDLCYNCSQENRGAGAGSFKGKQKIHIFADTFLNEKGFPKKDIYQEAAENAANAFQNARPQMSQKSIRSIFQMLKTMELRMRTEKDIPEEEVFDVFYKMERQVSYQEKREVVPRIFLDFVEKHKDLATKNKKEFLGFVEYLTSIMARMKTK